MTQEIKAAVLRDKGGPLQIESLEMEGPREDEVLVRLVASGICGTDVHFCERGGGDNGVVLGHEGAGVVEQVGSRVKEVGPDNHVVLSYQSCGECAACINLRPMACAHFYEANFGFARLDGSNALWRSGVRGHFFGQSSFATHALATERNLVKVDKDLPLEVLAPLGCGLQTGAGTVMNSLAVPKGASIAVFGTGTVGLAAIMAARIVGAGPIIGVDLIPERLEMALELGADHTIDTRRGDPGARISEITGGVDYTVESTGDPGVLHIAIDKLNPGGTAALLTGASDPNTLSHGRRALAVIQGDAVPQQFIPHLIELYRSGKFPFDRLVKFYAFHKINHALDEVRRGKTIKAVLRFGE